MGNSNKTVLILCILIAVVFVVGVVKLFTLRFEAGDVYAPYSSLRADPLGTKAFYASLEALNTVTVRRTFRPVFRSDLKNEETVFFLGTDSFDIATSQKEAVNSLESFIVSGGRLVMSFSPGQDGSAFAPGEEKVLPAKTDMHEPEDDEEPSSDDGGDIEDVQEEEAPIYEEQWLSLPETWGFTLAADDQSARAKTAHRFSDETDTVLPDSLAWHTKRYFKGLGDAWNVVYAVDECPVLIERRLGRGTIVLSTDSYFLSNEALRNELKSGLLAWLVGPHYQVVFDEYHLGIRKNPGIAALARKYRLQWFFSGLLLLAGLFVWKNTLSFVPPQDDEATRRGGAFSSRRDYTEGLISLLRRSIPAQQILPACLQEWKKTFSHNKRFPSETFDDLEKIAATRPSGKDGPVAGYRAICHLLSERKRS